MSNNATYFSRRVLQAAIKVAEQEFLAFPEWARKACNGSLVAVIEDGNIILYINPAREQGGYDASKRFAVRAGRQVVEGCPAFHGAVEYIL